MDSTTLIAFRADGSASFTRAADARFDRADALVTDPLAQRFSALTRRPFGGGGRACPQPWRMAAITLRHPRLRHTESAGPEEQAAFKKNSRRSLPSVGSAIPTVRSRCGRRTRRGSASRP